VFYTKITIILKLKYLFIFSVLAIIAASIYVLVLKPKDKIEPLTQSWEKVIPHQKIPEGLISLKSEDCGTCHQAHYEEWKLSTHAHAWTDLQFQSELKKESSPFLCINCHIPLQNQQEWIVSGLINGDIYKPVKEKNPFYDKELQMEGINCASCHVRDGAIVGVNGNLNAPHKVKKDPEHLSETLCISCHNANAVVTPTLACTFETGDEWKNGPYFGKKNCISCHMTEIERPLMAGFPKRKSHQHFFSGSGIPKFDTVTTTILNGLGFYPSIPKKKIKESEKFSFNLKVKNEFAGHRVPSGDPERFILIKFQILDKENKIIEENINRIGEKWEWYPVAKKISDNNMNPGEIRDFLFETQNLKAGAYQLKVIVTKHRMDEETAKYNKLGKNYPLYINIYENIYPLVVTQ
jgi:nitrate reductase cytochrome c-type subunit